MTLTPKQENVNFLKRARKDGLVPELIPKPSHPKQLSFRLKQLAEIVVTYRPGYSWADIAKKAGYSERQVHNLRKTKRFLDACRLVDKNFSTIDLIDAKGARRKLVSQRHWLAVKDVIDREEGPVSTQSHVEVSGGLVIPIIIAGVEDLMAPPIRDDLIKQMKEAGKD